jgi:putative chitinase
MMSTELLAAQMGAGKFSIHIERACIRWGIIDGRDKCRFLAQCYVESQGFKRVEENLRYTTVKRLLDVFGSRNGLNATIAANLIKQGPMAIANFVYGGEWGRKNLGNTHPGDGWNFRGQGLIQTTGRDNTRALSVGMFGDNRLLTNPFWMQSDEGAAESAAYYWYSRKCNGIESVREVTRRINPALLELDKRVQQTERAYRLLELMKS